MVIYVVDIHVKLVTIFRCDITVAL